MKNVEKAVGVGYVDGRLLAVIPYDDFEWEQSVKDIPIQAILNKLATNYGKPDKIIKREFSSLREDCKILSDFLRQNNLTMPFSCTENTESYFWIEKPWVQTIEIVFDENNNPQTITRSIINYQRYKSIAEEEKAVQEQLRRDAEKRQEDERKRLEQEKQQKIDNFNI